MGARMRGDDDLDFEIVFIGGCPRSGTTLLRACLDSHPDVSCGPELRFLAPIASLSTNMRQSVGGLLAAHYGVSQAALDEQFATIIRSFLEPIRRRSGKRVVGEKTPANALHFAELSRLFPRARFLQIVRDGRDVVSSLLTMDWTDHRSGARLDMTSNAADAAGAWVRHVRSGRLAAPDRYLEIRYESLVRRPEYVLRAVFDFIGVPWSDRVLDFAVNRSLAEGRNESSAAAVRRGINAGSISRWKRDLRNEDRAAVKAVAADLLLEMDYARDDRW